MGTLGTTSTHGRKIVEKRDDMTALAVTGRGRADRSNPTGHGQRTYTHTKHAPLKIKTGHGRRERPNSVLVVHKAEPVKKMLIPSSVITGSQAQPAKKAAVAAGGSPKQRAKLDGVATVGKALVPAFTRNPGLPTPVVPKVAQSVETKVKRSLHEPHGTSYKGYRNTPQRPTTAGENNYFAKGLRLKRRPELTPITSRVRIKHASWKGHARMGNLDVTPLERKTITGKTVDHTGTLRAEQRNSAKRNMPRFTGKTGIGKAYDPEGKRHRRAGFVGGAGVAGGAVALNSGRRQVKGDTERMRQVSDHGLKFMHADKGTPLKGIRVTRKAGGKLGLGSALVGGGLAAARYGSTDRGRSW